MRRAGSGRESVNVDNVEGRGGMLEHCWISLCEFSIGFVRAGVAVLPLSCRGFMRKAEKEGHFLKICKGKRDRISRMKNMKILRVIL